ncbi:Liprin-beta-1 [Merluccius polli]|uniref:Liprin-beta-1 n=1 Tax=Merluccius polli TaxID=89951 RepID=A0AA47NLY5_MERPO|nr:Liprin-beta-1 [Merluccius polli]
MKMRRMRRKGRGANAVKFTAFSAQRVDIFHLKWKKFGLFPSENIFTDHISKNDSQLCIVMKRQRSGGLMLGSVAMESEASHMLEAALEQMDDIIAGASTELSSGVYDLGSPVSSAPLQVVQLAEELKLSLDLQPSQEDRENLRSMLPEETARALLDWLQCCRDVNLCSPAINENYQERLLRLEGDKESLVLQVSVLTDQVEAQGEKIRDLESSLEEHHQKLVSTEEMLQQELLSRTSLEGEKLDLMDEVSHLKLKMVGMEEEHTNTHTRESPDSKPNKAECVVNLISELQEQMCRFQEEISNRIQEKQALERREAQQRDVVAGQARAMSPKTGSAGSDLCLSGPDPGDCRVHGGQSVHDLVQEVKQLRNKVDELEEEKSHYERKLRVTKSLMTQLSSLKLTVEHTQLEKQHWEEHWRSAQVEIETLQELLSSKDTEIHSLHNRLMARESSLNNNGGKDQEFQKLKRGMESLLASNDEKDRHIEELTTLLGHYRKVKDVAVLTQASSEEELSSSLRPRALTHKAHSEILRSEASSSLLMSSASCQRELDFGSVQSPFKTFKVTISDASYLNGSWQVVVLSVWRRMQTCDHTTLPGYLTRTLEEVTESQNRALSSSLEELQSGSSKAVEFLPHEPESSDAVAKSQHMDVNKYRTLPGKLSKAASHRTDHLNGEQERDRECSPSPRQLSPVKSHNKDYTLSRPESLLEESCFSDQSPLSSGGNSEQHSPVSPENRKSHRGIRKLWGKIRRSQSGSPVALDDADAGEFRRGGYRATAGPRLARAGNTRDLKTPFHKWTNDQLCDWLEDMGLGQYGVLSRHWLSSGQTLVLATPHELEKEMGLKNPLHRKKLQLAVKMLCSKQVEKSAELDHIWVTRWLDDIGLPQYKDQFNEGRVDGHMLQYLTVNDLLFLKVSSQLHHLSIKCAIHVLRVNQFHPNCLKRRPSNENQTTPSEVVQWSNHRVMEWLRSVDLAEYAPNLRGSGVHGGLIILEPRFNSDTLAMLLNIPPQKTLLRRHLASNFDSLVGGQAQQEKKEYMEVAGYAPLNTTAKIRPKKLVFSNLTHLRRRRPCDSTDYICPLDSPPPASLPQPSSSSSSPPRPSLSPQPTGPPAPSYAGFRGLSPILDREPSPHAAQQVGPDDS